MVCTSCKRTDGTHTAGCRRQKGCKLCARRAPEKCFRHGGKPKSATPKRARRKRPPVHSPHPNGAGSADARALLMEHLEEELVNKRAEVRVLEGLLAKAQARA
jgi:hypothetical protein